MHKRQASADQEESTYVTRAVAQQPGILRLAGVWWAVRQRHTKSGVVAPRSTPYPFRLLGHKEPAERLAGARKGEHILGLQEGEDLMRVGINNAISIDNKT